MSEKKLVIETMNDQRFLDLAAISIAAQMSLHTIRRKYGVKDSKIIGERQELCSEAWELARELLKQRAKP